MKLARRVPWFFLLALILVGCGPAIGSERIAATGPKSLTLEDGDTIGQTFVAHYGGLAGIEIYIQPRDAGDGQLRMRLRAGPHATADLAIASLPVAAITRPGFYRLAFAPQPDSRGRDYYALFELAGSGRIKVDRAAADAYLDGSLYQDGKPIEAQLTGSLIYNIPQLVLGLAGQLLGWIGMALAGVFLYIIPGWVLLVALWPSTRALPWGAKVGLAAGLSLALYPLLLLWTNLVGLHLGPLYAWVPPLAGLTTLLWHNRARRPARLAAAWRSWARSPALWPDLALLIVIGLLVGVRFASADAIDAPLWGDSYHHTLIAQLLVDNGGLFNSWQPYAEMQTLTYHFGFHTAAATLHWFSGLALPQAIIWAGQLLNVLAVLALYPLAFRIGGSRWAGVGALLLAGLLVPMPAYYVNWGRYTQLAGQAILPAAIYLIWAAGDDRYETMVPGSASAVADAESQLLAATPPLTTRRWHYFIPPWIALAGLGLAHYRVLIFVVFFFPALLLLRLGRQPLRSLLARMAGVALGAGLLFLPWFIHVFAGRILAIFAIWLTTPATALPPTTQEYNAAIDPQLVLPALVWLLLLFSLAWGLWRRERSVPLIGLWWLFVLLAVNPHWLSLPGTGALTNFALLIAAYIPAGVLIGAAFGWLVCAATDDRRMLGIELHPSFFVRRRRLVLPVGMVLFAALALWGATRRLGDLEVPQHALVTRPDLRAAAWIRTNTPPDARFLINAFFAFGDSSVVGSDGGWWLPLLAGRQTTLPPLLYVSEQAPRPDYYRWVTALPALLQQQPIDAPTVLAMLRERGVSYVYIGQRQGRVNYTGPAVLQPQQLLDSAHFRPIYHEDRVWVFEVVQ